MGVRRGFPLAWSILLTALPVAASEAPLGGAFTGEGAPAAGGGLVLCTNIGEGEPFAPLLAAASKALRPKAVLNFAGDDLASAAASLRELRPSDVVVVAPPETLDLTFHLAALELCLSLDGDPFPDFRLGYVTAAVPAEGERFLVALARAGAPSWRHPPTLTETGPAVGSRLDPESPEPWCKGLKARRLFHAEAGFLFNNRAAVNGRGVLLLFGKASPWGIESGLQSRMLREPAMAVAPAIVASSEDDLGSVDYYYPDGLGGPRNRIRPEESFCLAALAREPSALLLALGPGLPGAAEREIERLALLGESVGEVLRAGAAEAVLALGKEAAKEALARDAWKKAADAPAHARALGRALYGDPRFAPWPQGLGRSPVRAKAKAVPGGFEVAVSADEPGKYRLGEILCLEKGGLDGIAFAVALEAPASAA
ncbi:MAG: hypothetical protein MUC63_06590, partial [Planctomycetes bacterium]|nr:hypothetical protein [Planctomycetota bacterium]